MTGPGGASGASGASGITYPVYTDNLYDGGVDQYVPAGGASVFDGTVEEFDARSDFPELGTEDTLYLDLSTQVRYRWENNQYVEVYTIADLGNRSQQDWQEQLFGGLTNSLGPLGDLFAIITETFLDVLNRVVEVFSGFLDLDKVIDVLNDVLQFFYNLFDRSGFLNLFGSIMDFFEWLWFGDGTEDGFQGFGSIIESALKPLFEFFGWLMDRFGDLIEPFLKPVLEVISVIWDAVGQPVLEAFGRIIESIAGLIDLDFLKDLIEQVASVLGAFLNPQQFADLFTRIVDFFTGLVDLVPGIPVSLEDLLRRIPLLSTLISTITGKSEADGISLDLTTLGNWARQIEKDSKGAFDQVTELARRLLPGFLPPPDGGTDVNLLSQGDFASVGTIDAADGWSWDNTVTASGSGGSAKLVASGSAQRLYSKQSIPVVAGDVITMSAKVKTSGFTAGTGRSMAMSIVPWNGTSRILDGSGNPTSVQATPRTTSAADWVTLSGSYTIPAGVTSIQARLAVTANGGALIWFDDISVKKKSEMGQGYVKNLIQTWRDIYFNATGFASDIFSDAVGLAIGAVRDIGDLATGAIEDTNLVLFGDSAGGSTVVTDNLPLDGIGAEILPTAGSGAQISRRNTVNIGAAPGDQKFVAGFYDHIDVASTDIEILNSSNAVVTGTGTKSNLAAIYRVTNDGWYLIELCIRLNPTWSGGGKVAPLLWRSANYPTTAMSKYKMGHDGVYIQQGFSANGPRFIQSSFIVYLPAGGAVQGGYNAEGLGLDVLDADSDGTETYFSISMLNKDYAGSGS